jgi:predicted lipoprotein with Yx(FWY)xxD motif
LTFAGASAALPLAALAVAGCGSGSNNTTTASTATNSAASPTPTTISRPAAIRVANNAKLGKILVDAQGRTLYLFKKDSGTKSACFGQCATFWPPLRANGTPTAGGGATASLVGTAARSDGGSQVTYNGHPLYRFAKDTKRGDTNGEGVNAFGGSWFAVSPAGKQVSAKSAKPAGGNRAAPPAPKPAQQPAPAPRPAAPPAPKPAKPPSNGIPQNGGGDGDADNNGGPSDGDGAQ